MARPSEATCECGCGRTFPAPKPGNRNPRRFASPACRARGRINRRAEERTELLERLIRTLITESEEPVYIPPEYRDEIGRIMEATR